MRTSVTTLVAAAAGLASYAAACNDIEDVTLTFYGFPDNSPPGAGVAYDCGGRNFVAGGSGTFDDPLTVATAPGELNQCEVIYIPYLKKYARVEDECEQCTTDWGNGQWHVDIWTGSSTVNGGQDQINCEDDLTPNAQSIIRNPDSSYEVDSTALYSNGNCNTGNTYNNNPASNYC